MLRRVLAAGAMALVLGATAAAQQGGGGDPPSPTEVAGAEKQAGRP